MRLFEELQKQRYEALRDFSFHMWGVVMHPKTVHELLGELMADRDVCWEVSFHSGCNADYIFGLRIIPSFGVAPQTFTIVDESLGKTILDEPDRARPRRGDWL